MYLLHITNKTSIKDIQNEFNNRYPSLWLAFYLTPKNKVSFMFDTGIDPEKKLKEFCNSGTFEPINISEVRTVCEVKTDIKKRCGLEVHILRKCGNLWVDTTLTEDWTLAYQNSEGAQFG